jgi:hypothetical protein
MHTNMLSSTVPRSSFHELRKLPYMTSFILVAVHGVWLMNCISDHGQNISTSHLNYNRSILMLVATVVATWIRQSLRRQGRTFQRASECHIRSLWQYHTSEHIYGEATLYVTNWWTVLNYWSSKFLIQRDKAIVTADLFISEVNKS